MKYRLVLIVTIALLVWLGLCQVLFRLIQFNTTKETATSIEFQLKDAVATSNMDRLYENLATIESLGTIRCVRLRLDDPLQTVFDSTHRGECNVSPWALNGESYLAHMTSLNGAAWTVSFVSVNQSLFAMALSLARAGGLVLVLLVVSLVGIHHRARTRLAEVHWQAAESIKKIGRQVAHDIRSPLSYLRQVALQSPNSQNVNLAVDRIDKIAQDLVGVDWDRLVKAPKSSSLVELGQLKHEVSLLIDEKKKQSNRKISFSDQCRSGSSVNTHITDLKRVLSNLLNNSIEATDVGGEIHLALSAFGAHRVRLTLLDNGCGMTEEQIRWAGKRQHSTKAGGHGLGLAGAMEFVNAWGGELKIVSKVGVGTQIDIDLPMS